MVDKGRPRERLSPILKDDMTMPRNHRLHSIGGLESARIRWREKLSYRRVFSRVEAQLSQKLIADTLLAGYRCEPNPQTGFSPFAFRLHQFISRGDTVYASLEAEDKRYLTLNRQQFVPNDRSRILLPLVFCRECGQEYYCIRRTEDDDDSANYSARELQDRSSLDKSVAGFLFLSADHPWPSGTQEEIDRVPDDWKEETGKGIQIKRSLRKMLPRPVSISKTGQSGGDVLCHFLPAPFRFCLYCGVSHSARTTSNFGKLTSLGTEGRSTATTILSLATVRHLHK
jgi:hypothetical protein